MEVERDPSREFGIIIKTGARTRQYYMTANSEEDCNSWVKAFSETFWKVKSEEGKETTNNKQQTANSKQQTTSSK